MTRASSLPPDYTIRQARKNDIAIYQIILWGFIFFIRTMLFPYFLTLGLFLGMFYVLSITIEDFPISMINFISLPYFWMPALLIPLLIIGFILLKFFFKIASIIDRKDGSIVLLIEHNNRLVAYAMQTNKGSYWLLESLYVKPDYRRIGLGSCLVENLADRGVRPIYVIPTLESFRLYIRHGFTLVQEQNLPRELHRTSRCLGLI